MWLKGDVVNSIVDKQSHWTGVPWSRYDKLCQESCWTTLKCFENEDGQFEDAFNGSMVRLRQEKLSDGVCLKADESAACCSSCSSFVTSVSSDKIYYRLLETVVIKAGFLLVSISAGQVRWE